MNKKGFSNVFFVFLVVITFIFFITPISLKLSSEPAVYEGIGAHPIRLINSYDTVNDFKIYIDKSAELASCQAFYDQAKNGGFFESKCDKKDNYVKWDSNCNPLTSSVSDYKRYFNKEFKKHLDFGASYIYWFNKTTFFGSTESKVEKTYQDIKYFINPSFSIKTEFDLEIYNEIGDEVDQNIGCLSNEKINPKQCIKDDKWSMKKEGKLMFFDVKTGVKCVVKEGDKYSEKEVEIKFFRDFAKKDLLKTKNLLGQEQ